MRKEVSCGGVVVSGTPDTMMVLLLKDPAGKWTFPKGLIEKDENQIDCAAREIAEEVGLKHVVHLKDLTDVHYKYRWENELIDKTVHYFLFKGDQNMPLSPQAEEGIQEVKWFLLPEARRIVGYRKTNVPLLKLAQEIYTA
mgnify:CR=1 FL=1